MAVCYILIMQMGDTYTPTPTAITKLFAHIIV
jgi:hypothetical protein